MIYQTTIHRLTKKLKQCQSWNIMYLYTISFTYSTFFIIQIHYNTNQTIRSSGWPKHGVGPKSALDLPKLYTSTAEEHRQYTGLSGMRYELIKKNNHKISQNKRNAVRPGDTIKITRQAAGLRPRYVDVDI